MVLHAEDRMAHRGHAVYDIIPLVYGHLYQLGAHVDRALAAAGEAGVRVGLSPEGLKRVLLDTAAASRKLNGALVVFGVPSAVCCVLCFGGLCCCFFSRCSVPCLGPLRPPPSARPPSHRPNPHNPHPKGHVIFWLSAGAGGFGLSSSDIVEPSLFALVTTEFAEPGEFDRTKGWRARASPVEPPPEYFASFKNVSGLVGAVAQLEAEANDCDVVRGTGAAGWLPLALAAVVLFAFAVVVVSCAEV
jgi:hypothetical protein